MLNKDLILAIKDAESKVVQPVSNPNKLPTDKQIRIDYTNCAPCKAKMLARMKAEEAARNAAR